MGKRINVYSVQLVKESAKVYDLEDSVIRSPQDGRDIINSVLNMEAMTKEHFVVATLTTKNKVAGIHTIHIGALNSSLVSSREIFQQAILNNAASIICFHNHPSGDPTPSREDIEVTKRLKQAGDILGIDVLDHMIIGHNGNYVSLKEKGYL